MSEHLTGDIMEADYLVDLSNVVRRATSPGLHQLDRLVDALATRDNDPDVVLYLVADRSLPNVELPRADARTLREWEREGLVELLGDADVRLLELAELTGLSVITADRYNGYRDMFPWVQGNTNQFIEPIVEHDGRLVLRDIDMGIVNDWSVSRHAEQDVLKKQGVMTRFDVLERAWLCPDRACTLYDTTQGGFVLIPRIRSGEPTCELHGLRLRDNGARPAAAPMKILVDGQCVDRFLVPADTQMVIGRAPSDGVSLHPWLTEDEGLKVSRRHFMLSFVDGSLTIRDVSRNGTRVQIADFQPVTLRGSERILGLGDIVWCTRRVAVTRSGRQFPNELMTRRAQPTRDHEITRS